jgi:hypothetical protein
VLKGGSNLRGERLSATFVCQMTVSELGLNMEFKSVEGRRETLSHIWLPDQCIILLIKSFLAS